MLSNGANAKRTVILGRHCARIRMECRCYRLDRRAWHGDSEEDDASSCYKSWTKCVIHASRGCVALSKLVLLKWYEVGDCWMVKLWHDGGEAVFNGVLGSPNVCVKHGVLPLMPNVIADCSTAVMGGKNGVYGGSAKPPWCLAMASFEAWMNSWGSSTKMERRMVLMWWTAS